MPKRGSDGAVKSAAATAAAAGSGFRDRKRRKAGVVTYDFKPKDADPFRFSEIEAEKAWPARKEDAHPLLPTGSPTYEPGSVIHFGVVVPGNCLMRFSEESLRGIVGLVMDEEPVAGRAQVGETRLYPLLRQQAAPAAAAGAAAPQPPADWHPPQPIPADLDAVEEGQGVAAPLARPPLVPNHQWMLEAPCGPILPFAQKVEVMVNNTVVKTLELNGTALQRQHGLAVRSAKKKFGPNMDVSPTNYYLPMTPSDLDPEEPSPKLRKVAEELCRGKNARFLGKSPLYGFPFEYDPVLKMLHNHEHQSTLYFGPGVHVEIRVTLVSRPSGLRCLLVNDENLTSAEKEALWARNPRVRLDAMWLQMVKICFPPMSPFLKGLEQELKKNGGRDYAFTAPSEMRHPVLNRMSEQEWAFSLQQLGLPSYVIFYWDTNEGLDGASGHVPNSSVWRFPPNLESLNVTYQGESLLAGGPVTKLDVPGADTADKMSFFEQQMKFRRDPRTYSEFFDEGFQQYVFVDTTNLYLQDSKMHELDKIHLKLKFNNDLSPEGWQIGVLAVSEKKFTLKSTGEHFITNAAGKTQI